MSGRVAGQSAGIMESLQHAGDSIRQRCRLTFEDSRFVADRITREALALAGMISDWPLFVRRVEKLEIHGPAHGVARRPRFSRRRNRPSR